jgi:hypothetical protein
MRGTGELTMAEFTGYVIEGKCDLHNLKQYGFYKTEPAETNPWWQRPFDVKFDNIGTWESELLVNRNDRKLLAKHTDACNLDKLNATVEKMRQDGILRRVDNGCIYNGYERV